MARVKETVALVPHRLITGMAQSGLKVEHSWSDQSTTMRLSTALLATAVICAPVPEFLD